MVMNSMANISTEELERWKTTFAKDGIIYSTDEEYCEAINNLVGLFELLIQIDQDLKDSGTAVDSEDSEKYLIDKDGIKIIL